MPWHWAVDVGARKVGHGRRTIARLKITLGDVEPPVLRRIEVPVDIGLERILRRQISDGDVTDRRLTAA